jgi:hypothetical protein
MGGYGSGRPSQKNKVEEYRSLDINKFHRDGCLIVGKRGNWSWSRDGSEIVSIGFSTQATTMTFNYRVRVQGGDWETIEQAVPIERMPCNYGNQRPYFRCSGVVRGRHCNRRVVKLYAGGRYLLCRHCYNLAYSSQSEERSDRMLRRANKLRTALGGERGTAHFIAPRPKGMSQRKYLQKRLEIEWCEGQANELFISKYSHLLSREEREMYFGDH